MTMKYVVNTTLLFAGMAMATAVWAAPQEPAHSMAAMGQSASQAAVTECAQVQPQAILTIETANQRLEAARQSNSPAAMRSAMDDLQSALRQLRAELGACAGLQAASGADMPAGHVTPGGQQGSPCMSGMRMPGCPESSGQQGGDQQSSNGQSATPAGPGTAMANPGSTATTPAIGGTADPHAGHVMPGAPQTPAPARATPQPPAAQQAAPRGLAASTPATPDPHAGHVMPGAPQAATPAGAAAPTTPQPQTAAGQDTAHMPGHNMANMSTGAASLGTALDLPTRPQDLACANKVDPKTAPRAAYAGKTYYFCSAVERDQFVKAPAAYRQKQ
jgi:YHS domain-containing protein